MLKVPDRLSSEKGSKYYSTLGKRLGISINGVEQHETVVEYCISGMWARVRLKDSQGNWQRNFFGTGKKVARIDGCEIKVWIK